MEYAKGRIGRVFTVRVDHGDDLILELIKLAELEKIESAVFMLLGALKEGKLVTGPKENRRPPEPVWSAFNDAHEILGIGDIFQEDGKPKIHLHAGTAREDSIKLGCLRGESEGFYGCRGIHFRAGRNFCQKGNGYGAGLCSRELYAGI